MCAAATGERCLTYSRLALRKEPHSERKYYAIEAIEHHYGHNGSQMVIRTSTSVESGDIRQGPDSVDKSY